jgi:hypothetical protein
MPAHHIVLVEELLDDQILALFSLLGRDVVEVHLVDNFSDVLEKSGVLEDVFVAFFEVDSDKVGKG